MSKPRGKARKTAFVRKKSKKRDSKGDAPRIPRKLNPKEARKILGNVSADRSLWIVNGLVLRNLQELLKALKNMNDLTFRYHANKQRNDFYKWTKEVIGDMKLAKAMKSARTRGSAVKKLDTRVKQLKKILK